MEKEILGIRNIKHNLGYMSKEEAINLAGELLVKEGYVTPSYIGSMHQRENLTSTYIGNSIGIPHGTDESKKDILHSGITVLHFKEPIDYNGEKAQLIIGIAGRENEHISILSKLAISLAEEEVVKKIICTSNDEELYQIFSQISNQ
ncbi:PTS sugar transporter subunit IIA [Oceanobacillus jeddahense]|uniref:Mannitol-specific phosphotransferase enzyme IIA component n=1 Tax=Oceanobacillus jeddahense TaxID=1462527 RepID=A0ABY5JPX8_9BACI|nr:PTS sugar transporter subunit IIA [Oceanobacillus jeddahense]UUI02360.1 PTS sugar transporter subunit IIA [Oceanobacillus jeddahense]